MLDGKQPGSQWAAASGMGLGGGPLQAPTVKATPAALGLSRAAYFSTPSSDEQLLGSTSGEFKLSTFLFLSLTWTAVSPLRDFLKLS